MFTPDPIIIQPLMFVQAHPSTFQTVFETIFGPLKHVPPLQNFYEWLSNCL